MIKSINKAFFFMSSKLVSQLLLPYSPAASYFKYTKQSGFLTTLIGEHHSEMEIFGDHFNNKSLMKHFNLGKDMGYQIDSTGRIISLDYLQGLFIIEEYDIDF